MDDNYTNDGYPDYFKIIGCYGVGRMEQAQQHRWRILQIVNIGTFISTLDIGIVNVALPSMASQFGVPLAHIQWVITAYLLTMIALLPIVGKLSDQTDRRKVYSLGFFIFAVGSLLAALSNSFTLLIISRCIQGVGATLIMANSQAMVRMLFSNQERGKALGNNAIVISIGTLSGPALGGFLLECTGWPLLFAINIPLGIAAAWLGLRYFPKSHANNERVRMDWTGSVAISLAIILLMLASVQFKQKGVTVEGITLFVVGLLLCLLLIPYEYRLEHRIIDKILFTNRTVAIGNLTAFLQHLVQMATMVPIPFYMQEIMGKSLREIGFTLALQAICMGAIAPLGGWFRDRFGAFIPTLLGPLLSGLSVVYLLMSDSVSMTGLILQFCLFGVGMGLFQATNNAEIMTASPENKVSLVGSMLAMIRFLGMVAGTTMAVLFVGNLSTSPDNPALLSNSIMDLYAMCLIVSLLAVAVSFCRPRSSNDQ